MVKLIDINACKRSSISYLYIYAKYVKPFTKLNIRHKFEFPTITQQEIELRLYSDLENGLDDIWNYENRLTEYNEFTRRANQLLETLESGKLEELFVPPTPRWYFVVSHIFGFTALAIGLSLVVSIIYSMVFLYVK